ncbi:histone-lysine N-methyltransferase, H3 lysine-79 specific-like isoform X3 [Acanthochromis polyacanthus]|uniref:histone-lysine N-methyltransferase, H3 lysine-79 specific-like isoform X3 n=1 Tax=Acanthochromis polyacanthus TaxID=80966 RepID=UPI00223497B6|nr:histone-lysine N-methyltransferase, H3 lysine-79 specific-like isoform X3 [Acanthochromis polyacanthus]
MMGSVDLLESPSPVSWSCLLVISNVPNTPPGSSEVQKLVQRFGTVIKTLVLNNMVICEMATAAMALSVYKRFQMFPCILQSNPLFFSRKPDPRASTQTKTIAAFTDVSEETPAHDKGSEAAPDVEEIPPKDSSESPLEEVEKEGDRKDENVSTQETAEDGSEDKAVEKTEPTAPESSAAPQTNPEPEPDLVVDRGETSAVDSETAEEKSSACKEGTDEADVGDTTLVEIKPPSFDSRAASQETGMSELPKMTQAMVNALLVECRTRTINNTAAPPGGEKEATPMETNQEQKRPQETKESTKEHPEEEEVVKKQERERKEREAKKEKEARERERRERDRRTREKEDRTREREWTEKSRRERERREWERKERERRDRKRSYGENLPSGQKDTDRTCGEENGTRRPTPGWRRRRRKSSPST